MVLRRPVRGVLISPEVCLAGVLPTPQFDQVGPELLADP